jgi:hypothetical protein
MAEPLTSGSPVTGTRSLESFAEGIAPAPTAADTDEGGTRIGEVIESSTTTLIAEARRLHGAPDFGAFVRVDGVDASGAARDIVGTVHNASTLSLESNRRPVAYGKTEAELRREQPQIFELLRTQFDVFVLGTLHGEQVVHLFPPQPARIHSFVHPCSDEQVRAITEDPQFLRSLLEATGLPTDELLLATLGQALRVRGEGAAIYLRQMGAELSRLLRDDYERLSSLVRRLARSAA